MVTEILTWVRRVLRLHPVARARSTAETLDEREMAEWRRWAAKARKLKNESHPPKQ